MSKRIVIFPIILVFLSIFILYSFLNQNLYDGFLIFKQLVFTHKLTFNKINIKYLILFIGLILLSFSDMISETISLNLIIIMMLIGFILSYPNKLNMYLSLFSLLVGISIFIIINLTKIGYYAIGDVLTSGMIGMYVGIENIILISIFSIIIGNEIAYIHHKINKEYEQFHFAFVPILLLSTTITTYLNINHRSLI